MRMTQIQAELDPPFVIYYFTSLLMPRLYTLYSYRSVCMDITWRGKGDKNPSILMIPLLSPRNDNDNGIDVADGDRAVGEGWAGDMVR